MRLNSKRDHWRGEIANPSHISPPSRSLLTECCILLSGSLVCASTTYSVSLVFLPRRALMLLAKALTWPYSSFYTTSSTPRSVNEALAGLVWLGLSKSSIAISCRCLVIVIIYKRLLGARLRPRTGSPRGQVGPSWAIQLGPPFPKGTPQMPASLDCPSFCTM